jgi:hypothetical protein
VGQISKIKKYSGTTDTIIEIPEDLTVNEISNFPLKNTENKTIFIQNNAEISVTNHNLITTANGIDCQSAVEEEDTLFDILNRIGGLIRNLPPTVLPTPVAFNNSTIEAIHNPITYTPYIHFDNVISELGKHSIAVGGEEEWVMDVQAPAFRPRLSGPLFSVGLNVQLLGLNVQNFKYLFFRTVALVSLAISMY